MIRINETKKLVCLEFTKYEVHPFKNIPFGTDYRCEEEKADFYAVMDINGAYKLAEFSDKTKAEQFAIILQVSLNQIKAFKELNDEK